MSISSFSSVTNNSAQSLSDILEAQLHTKQRNHAEEKQSSTVSTGSTLDSAEFSPEALQAARNLMNFPYKQHLF